jgi:hypothetical protein
MITKRKFLRAAGMSATGFMTARSFPAWAQGASAVTKSGGITPAEARAIAKEAYTPADTTIQTINADTLYSFIGMDLRDEPIVITVPTVEKERYYGCSLFDLWGHCDMFGTRTTGNDAGSFLIHGPGWKGQTPARIKKVFPLETTLGSAAFRTQLFNPGDVENVKKVQAGYKVQTLSAFLGQPAPARTRVDFAKPLTVEQQKTSLQFFSAWVELNTTAKKLDTGEITPGDCYGTRAYLKNNYLYRATAIYLAGNAQPKEEVIYPFVSVDADGKPFDGAANRYVIRFAGDKLPPAKQFWSITVMRLYLPSKEAQDGLWKAPSPVKA